MTSSGVYFSRKYLTTSAYVPNIHFFALPVFDYKVGFKHKRPLSATDGGGALHVEVKELHLGTFVNFVKVARQPEGGLEDDDEHGVKCV